MIKKAISIFTLLSAVLLVVVISSNIPRKEVTEVRPVAAVKPNIIVIFTDDQRYNTLHALGGDQVITPNLDGLVKGGTTFTHAFNMGAWHGAVCVASRAMLLTGMSVWNVKKQEADYASLAAADGFWPQQMKRAGYETYMSGKWHVDTDAGKLFDHVSNIRPGMPNQTPQGYNRPLSRQDTVWQPWKEEFGGFWKGGKHWSEVLADDAVGYIRDASKKESPFFMYLAFNAPHDPRQAPKRWLDKYPVDQIKLPASYLDDYPYKTEMGCGTDLRDEQLAPFPRTPYAVKKNIQEYYASISYMDEQVGRILDALKKSGKMDNTYILFTADHGLSVGHHGLMGKQSMFDHSMRPPLVIKGPAIPKGEKRNQQVYLQDIMATSYELAGVRKPEHVFFNSLLPLVKDAKKPGPYTEIYGCYMNLQRMVRTERYKMIIYPAASKILLFDMLKDPQEMHDIFANTSSKKILKELKMRMLEQQKMMNDPLDLSAFLNKI
ncbi:N-acetylglucosamine-6-O-sulfatase [Dyadobacter sp. CECT 9275]|uniref:N-acetylglucosamine-6-O-sulfatase n=1 Tax=Dyadobacter helix TaxID=2822344 RepID=A0A916N5P4_9BACT|nr:sulfatase-like hydrolase/transferase [Dyadobacter sp. CECT 9275]CAG5006214.1 N-acetylglucosamine-6-O-sulfatase [Dyadobacter sp. CECT 9275]